MDADVRKNFEDFMADFKTALKIDRNALHVECSEQPMMHQEIGDQQVKAKDLFQKAKSRLKFVEADLATKIRANPSRYGVDKTTKEVVENTVVLQPEYKQADAELIEITTILGMLDVLGDTVDDRKSMIRDLVTLHVHNYYSEDDMSTEKREMIAKRQEEIVRQRRNAANKET